MRDLIHLGRFHKKILAVFSGLTEINRALEMLANDPKQSNAELLSSALVTFDGSVTIMKENIVSLVREISGDENEEIDVEITENGNLI